MNISGLLKRLGESEGAVAVDFVYTLTNQLAMSASDDHKTIVHQTLNTLERLIKMTRDEMDVSGGSLLTFMSKKERCPCCGFIAIIIHEHGVCGDCVDEAYNRYCPK